MKLKYRIVYGNTSIEAPDGEFLIGRGNDCHLVLDDPSVSRIHAGIIREDEGLYVEDKGSRNGVSLNGTLLKKKTRLKNGDQIDVGHQVIRIVVTERSEDADMTVGLHRCQKCGAWISSKESTCSHCGSRMDDTLQWSKETEASLLSREAEANRESVIEEQPLSMICGLAIKAIQVDKPEEAERLLENIISIASRRLKGGAKLNNAEFISVCNVLVVMADALKSPELISRLFSLHLAAKRLMSRDLVERLYNLVRSVGYRACPELSRYLSFLNLNASSFSPGERFIHRRLQTLPKICS